MASRFYMNPNSNETAEELSERKSMEAIYSILERKLENDEPLSGKTLDFAIELVTLDPNAEGPLAEKVKPLASKFKAGEPISNEEKSIVLDMLLVHHRLR